MIWCLKEICFPSNEVQVRQNIKKESQSKTARQVERGNQEKNGRGTWEKLTENELLPGSQAESQCVYMCVYSSLPSKWVELVISPRQQEMWEQVQLFFPRWLQGNSSHLPLPATEEATRFKERPANLFCRSRLCCLSEPDLFFCFFSSPDLIRQFSHYCLHVEILLSCDYDAFFIQNIFTVCVEWVDEALALLFINFLLHTGRNETYLSHFRCMFWLTKASRCYPHKRSYCHYEQ